MIIEKVGFSRRLRYFAIYHYKKHESLTQIIRLDQQKNAAINKRHFYF